MSDTPPHDSEVEEGSPFGGAECEESSPEPATRDGVDEEDGENVESLYPIQNLSVEYYEGGEDAPEASNANDNDKFQDASEMVEAEMSAENDETDDVDVTTTESEDLGLSYEESYSNQESLESDYKLQKTYIEDFIYSSAPSSSFDESSNSNFEDGREESKGSALARFPKIVKAIEVADYEILQVLYQLLYQRSAWDTQEILTQRILEFNGFGFSQNSEDYFNREMMLQTQPNEVLIKVAALLGLDQVQKVIANMDKARGGLIQCIMTFLSRPNKKTRTGKSHKNDDDKLPPSSAPSPSKCGCRSQCFKQIPVRQRQVILEYVRDLEQKRMLDSYLMHMIELRKIIRKPGSYEDLKKLKEVNYQYYIKYGTRELSVCKGAFVTMYNLTASKILQLQNKLKSGKSLPPKIDFKDFPPMMIVEPSPRKKTQERTQNGTSRPSVSRIRTNEKKGWISSEEQVRRLEADVDNEIKTLQSQTVVPKVLIEKLDVKSLEDLSRKKKEEVPSSKGSEESTLPKKESYQLKDFPLVVKAIESAPEELLIDVHFLLFLNSADEGKLKENILEFGGFSFASDTEEYDERNEFLQRMTFKMVSDVAKSFSLAILSKKEDTITNILTFLMKPDEKFLRVSATMPLSLSDVELDDDFGDLSDSDVSITCEVVEKKVECIDLLSSGEDSDREDKPRKEKSSPKVSAPNPNIAVTTSIMKNLLMSTQSATPTTVTPPVITTDNQTNSSTGGKRTLRNFETIRKIVNTHPHEYLVDIFDLLYLKTHEPSTLRSDILDFSGFTFEKGTPDYIKRKQLLDRMLYNSVRRIYNTLIHNTTEVKVFSKPTMIAEIFQFLFKLPDHDTSVRPPPTAKIPFTKPSFMAATSTVKNSSGTTTTIPTGANLLNQSAKLSDLKRVFQRVACFPCEYLIDVHKLLFMTDCDQNVIRQNIFAFKGFPFSPDSHEFQQRKMYLEYLTFHSLRKISSVLTTRSVDLRNSTKHELATHLTEVLAEYCKTPDAEAADAATEASNSLSTSAVENIVVTPIIDPSITGVPTTETSSASEQTTNSPTAVTSQPLPIAIVDARSINSSPVPPTPPDTIKRSRKRKNNTVVKVINSTPNPQQTDPQSQFADINLPEVEQYRQIYGTNSYIYPTSGPTIAGQFFNANGMVPQAYPQILPQALSFPVAYSQGTLPVVQQTGQLLGISPASQIVTQVSSNKSETIIPGDNKEAGEPPSKKANTGSSNEKAAAKNASDESNSHHNKSTTDDEDCDKPLSSLVGHPIDSVLKKHVADIVEQSDLQNLTINGVIQKVFDMYPKFDLSYRKEFLKSSLRAILYRLGQEKSSDAKSDLRDTESPDCSVTTTENCDNASESPKAMDCAQ